MHVVGASSSGTQLTFAQSGFGPDELDSAAQHEAGRLGGLADLRRTHELGPGWTPVSTELPAARISRGSAPPRRDR